MADNTILKIGDSIMYGKYVNFTPEDMNELYHICNDMRNATDRLSKLLDCVMARPNTKLEDHGIVKKE